jgi:uncharacterized protein
LKNAFRFVVSVLLAVVLSSSVQAEDARVAKLNQGTIGLVASQPELLGTALQISKAIDHTNGLRLLPIVGRGGLQTINDLMYLRSVDAALLSSDALAYVQKNGLYTEDAPKISYLAKLANANVIVLARREFTTLESLRGMRIAVGTSESDGFVAADLIFGSLGLSYEGVGMSAETAIKAMQDKTIDAAVFAGAGSSNALAGVNQASGLHIVPISADKELAKTYSPAILSHADFPNLIAADYAVETVASAIVLAVHEWPNQSERFQKLAKFNAALTTKYFPAQGPAQTTNFSATVPGWKTYVTATPPRKKQQPESLSVTALQ